MFAGAFHPHRGEKGKQTALVRAIRVVQRGLFRRVTWPEQTHRISKGLLIWSWCKVISEWQSPKVRQQQKMGLKVKSRFKL